MNPTLTAVLAAIVKALLTPLYWGQVLVPLAVVVAIATNIALPILVRQLGMSPIGSALPYLLWLLTVIVLASSRPEGDVLLPGGTAAQQAVTYGMLGGGALAGGITVARQLMPRPPSAAATGRPAEKPAEAQPRR